MFTKRYTPRGPGKETGAFPLPRKRRLHRWFAALLAVLTVFSTVAIALAATTIGTGSSTEYFEFVSNSGDWEGLGTPQHWDNSTGNVAYCLHHQKDSPPSGMTYNEFDPSAIMSSRVQAGLQIILENGYPAKTGGFSADQARYATANAIRAWLSENGTGYNFMNLANGKIRAKSGYSSLFSWMTSLVNLARTGTPSSNGTITVSPLSQQWQQAGSGYTASIRVTLSGVSSYSVTPPSGMTGFTGKSGDNLTFTSSSGAPVTLTFDGDTGGGSVSLYWYQPVSGSYQSVVVVDSSHGGVTVAYAQITLGDQIVTPTPTPTATPTPTPDPTYTLTVRKTDSRTGSALDGAQFELAQNGSTVYLRQTGSGQYEAGGSVGQFTTSGGTATISGLKAGSYTVTEVSAPSGYTVASASKNVSVSGSTTVELTNDPTELTLIKTDLHSGAAMQNVSFILKNASGQTMRVTSVGAGQYAYAASGGTETMTTDASGKIVVYGLPDGSYTAEESERVEGYTLMRPKSVTLSGKTSVDLTNEPLGIELLKRDEKTSQPMSGVQFHLLDASGSVVKVKGSAGQYEVSASGTATITTGVDGKARVLYVTPGTYTLREIAPAGYAQAADQTIVVSATNGYQNNPATITIGNAPLGLEFTKLDGMGGGGVSGGVFRLLDASGGTVRVKGAAGSYEASATGAETFTTNSTGVARIDYLKAGTYTVREETPPPGFAKAPDVSITVTESHTYKAPATISMKDEPLALELTKLDARTGEALSGAVFQLLDAQGKAVKLKQIADGAFRPDASGSDRFTIPASGVARIYYLPAAEYKIVEVEPPAGYSLANPINVTVSLSNDRSDPAQATVRDEPLMLRVIKKDSLSQKPLAGAVFRIVDASGKVVRLRQESDGAYAVDASGQETFTTDKNGEAVILYLPAGTDWRIVEVDAPDGYALAQESAVAMTDKHGAGNPQSVTIYDEPTAIEILKTDKLTGQPLPGAVFHLLDVSGEAVKFTKKEDGYHYDPQGEADIVSGSDGKAVLLYVPAANYVLREVSAPAGFARTAEQAVQLTNRHGLSAPLVFALADDVVSLEIVKSDALTEKSMEGVAFTLARDGEPVKATKQAGGEWYADPSGTDQIVTDAQGRIVLRYLTPGTYRLTETVPEGYAQPEPIEITITEEHGIGAPYRAAISNQPTALEILKTDMATGKPMSGMEFRLLGSGGKAVKLKLQPDGAWHPAEDGGETFKVDDDGKALLRYLPVGSCTVEETSTPEGYAKLLPQPVTIADDSSVEKPAKLHIQNQPLRLVIEKVDALTGLPVRTLSIPKYTASTVTTTQTTGQSGTIGGGATATTSPAAASASASPAPAEQPVTTYTKDGTTADTFTFRLIGPDGKAVKLAEMDGYLMPDANGKEVHGVGANGTASILYLDAGSYVVEEVTAPTAYAKAAAVKVEVNADNGMENPAVARIADKPLALEISKVRKDNGKGLSGAGFTLAVRGSDTPLTFTVKDGRYWYDPAGMETTIKVDKQGKALVAYLPVGTYDLVETVVPFGFFAAPAQTVTIEDKHTIDAPAAVKVENEAAVKLGLDSDRLRIPLALSLIFFACVGGTAVFMVIRSKKKR